MSASLLLVTIKLLCFKSKDELIKVVVMFHN